MILSAVTFSMNSNTPLYCPMEPIAVPSVPWKCESWMSMFDVLALGATASSPPVTSQRRKVMLSV